MHVTPFGPDDASALERWATLTNAVAAVDAPWAFPVTPAEGAGRFRHGWDGEPSTPYLARVDGEVVGWGSVSVSEYDNLDLAWLGVAVHPAYRRRGHGSTLLAELVEAARALGRTSLGMDGWESAAGAAFAERHGFVAKQSTINRRQLLADVAWAELDRRYDDALPHARDYAIERWAPPTPEGLLPALAELTSAINDAPTDGLDVEDEVYTADRVRAYETATRGRGERMYRVVARHVPTGGLAGQSVVAVEIDHPERGHQHDTSVVRSHRGHRLGLLLKAEMLRWLREEEPDLATIDTWNAESNDHMIGVNELLGYRVMGREIAYQRPLTG
ncbi:GNAT family N-acetyltransferase [Nocardioides sp. GY 10113]|uniref:GNAT family N-acetyltransferase n=1 Tax=Nocardioides sp. GY 10113 TaxID=2569761 RepID=UPI0014590BD8|nr:GNAT family N-acetyltransferase [Nocardioides sp. GY 10113]